MADSSVNRISVPRDRNGDDTRDAAKMRQEFIHEHTGVELEHVAGYTFDPSVTMGNVEHFIGVAQVPIGLAGPLLVNHDRHRRAPGDREVSRGRFLYTRFNYTTGDAAGRT